MKPSTFKLYILFAFLCIVSSNNNKYAPEIFDQEFFINELRDTGTINRKVNVFNQDEGQQRSFEIVNGNDAGTFSIELTLDKLSEADPAKLDQDHYIQIIPQKL